MKRILIPIVLLFMATSALANEKINIRSIGFDEVAYAGQEVPVFVGVRNVDDSRLDEVKVRIDSFDLDVFGISHDVDIRKNEAAAFIVPIDIPFNTRPGYYTIRITVEDDDDERRTYYRILTVI